MGLAYAQTAVSGVTASITDTTLTDVIAATAALRTYITSIQVTCGHATQGTYVNIREETSGTILWSGYCAPAGGGFSHSFVTPITHTTAGKKIQAICVTTGSDIRVCIAGYQAP